MPYVIARRSDSNRTRDAARKLAMNQRNLLEVDWSKIPAPTDDGAAAHLVGMTIPPISLVATDDTSVTLSALPGRTVVFAYPRTGEPGKIALVDDWDMIPGRARLHAADLRVPRSVRRTEGRRRRARVRPVDAEQRLPDRDGVAAASAVPGAVGREAGADPRAQSADHGGGGADADQAAGADHRRRRASRMCSIRCFRPTGTPATCWPG